MTDLKPTDAGIIERVYYAVPSHYTIGKQFPGTPEGLSEAVAYAKSKIRRIDYSMLPDTPDGWTRAWVDMRFKIRWLPASGKTGGEDTMLERHEIFLTETEKRIAVEAEAFVALQARRPAMTQSEGAA